MLWPRLKARGKKLGAANPRCHNLTVDARARGRVLAVTARLAGPTGSPPTSAYRSPSRPPRAVVSARSPPR